jgi:hypothetical protein
MDNIDLVLERNFGIRCGSEIGGYGSKSVRATDQQFWDMVPLVRKIR